MRGQLPLFANVFARRAGGSNAGGTGLSNITHIFLRWRRSESDLPPITHPQLALLQAHIISLERRTAQWGCRKEKVTVRLP